MKRAAAAGSSIFLLKVTVRVAVPFASLYQQRGKQISTPHKIPAWRPIFMTIASEGDSAAAHFDHGVTTVVSHFVANSW